MPAGPFDRLLLALRLSTRNRLDDSAALAPTLLASSIDLHPHQIEAAVFALTRPGGRGAILADEVGLGKTIEAGLVIAQTLAAGAARVLVLVPSSLRAQWRSELERFFGIRASLQDLTSLRREKGRFRSRGVHIASLTFFANDTNPPEFREADWDLVVIDEAHRLRNVWKPGARRARRLRELLRGKRKLLLTATPFQNSLLELFGLVSFVDDKLLGTEASFRSRFLADERGLQARNDEELRLRLGKVLQRTLRRQVLDTIRFTERRSLLYDFEPFPAERELYDRVSDYFSSSRTLALAFGNRELLLLAYRKILASSSFAVAATLRKLAVTLAERLGGQLARAEPPDLSEEIEGLEDEAEEMAAGIVEGELLGADDVEREIAELRSYIALADSITRNAKGERLLGALREVFGSARAKGLPEKAVVFTESRRTQDYLKRLLDASGFLGRVTLLHGGSGGAEERDALVQEFRHRSQVFLATEAGAEGLNLQFCNVVVNYDLPWNPQRIEQRIGRCHRYGQEHDVLVVNFLNTANAADRRLIELLSAKLNLFDGVFGSSDDVLGALESGVDFERRVLAIYQTCRTPAEIDGAFDALQGELDELRARRLDSRCLELLDHFDDQVRERLHLGRQAMERILEGTERAVRDLVLGTALKAEPETGGEVYRVELPKEVAEALPAAARVERVRFAKGQPGTLLGPLHPLVVETARWVQQSEGPPAVHEVMVHAGRIAPGLEPLAALRGRRGYWLLHLIDVAAGEEVERHLIEVAALEGAGSFVSDEELDAIRRAERECAGYSALAPPGELLEVAADALRGRAEELRTAAAARALAALDEERARLERFAAETLAEAERHLSRSRAAAEQAQLRAEELRLDARASDAARRQAASLADLMRGQLRSEQHLLAEDVARRQREQAQALADLAARLETTVTARLAGIARFWVV